jgi:hypothetical protein
MNTPSPILPLACHSQKPTQQVTIPTASLKYPNLCAETQPDKAAATPNKATNASQSFHPAASGAAHHITVATTGSPTAHITTFRVSTSKV